MGQDHATVPIVFIFLVEMGVYYVGQAGLKLLTSSDLPASASQSARITGMSHCTWPEVIFNELQDRNCGLHKIAQLQPKYLVPAKTLGETDAEPQ